MAKRQVVQSECDRCHTVQELPMEPRPKYSRDRTVLDLPKGWLHVSGVTASNSLVFEVDLCEVCKGVVLDAAGRSTGKASRGTLRAVSSS